MRAVSLIILQQNFAAIDARRQQLLLLGREVADFSHPDPRIVDVDVTAGVIALAVGRRSIVDSGNNLPARLSVPVAMFHPH
jgi:hypothetical protein